MRRFAIVPCTLAIVLMCAAAVAQPLPPIAENHYVVYQCTKNRISPDSILSFTDQFGLFKMGTSNVADLIHFANPASKNGEPIYDASAHHAWWRVGTPPRAGEHLVMVTHQFGSYQWNASQLTHFITPSNKYENDVPDPLPPLPKLNHYLAWTVLEGASLDTTVTVSDQFGTRDVFLGKPMYLCNPAEKRHDEFLFPVVDPHAHLACYEIVNGKVFSRTVTMHDQFQVRGISTATEIMLCIPCLKDETVPTKESTWGRIKSLYTE